MTYEAPSTPHHGERIQGDAPFTQAEGTRWKGLRVSDATPEDGADAEHVAL